MRNGPYELVVVPVDYPGRRYRNRYVYEHQLVWWQHTGSLVTEGKAIHHKDHNKRNNCFSNLELISVAAHTKLHHKSAAMLAVSCAWCGVIFKRSVRDVKSKEKHGQRLFYCSRSHAVHGQHSAFPDGAIGGAVGR